jgi:hypothetical protein
MYPFDLARCADMGDALVNPADLQDSLAKIAASAAASSTPPAPPGHNTDRCPPCRDCCPPHSACCRSTRCRCRARGPFHAAPRRRTCSPRSSCSHPRSRTPSTRWSCRAVFWSPWNP